MNHLSVDVSQALFQLRPHLCIRIGANDRASAAAILGAGADRSGGFYQAYMSGMKLADFAAQVKVFINQRGQLSVIVLQQRGAALLALFRKKGEAGSRDSSRRNSEEKKPNAAELLRTTVAKAKRGDGQ